MKKIICLVMLMMLLLAAIVPASAEQVTANGDNYENVPFSNGYFGYCIDRSLSGAYTGDVFTVANSTSVATSNTTNSDISQSLKLLFTQNFDAIFEANADGSYVMKSDMINNVLGAVYHFSEDQYVWGAQKTLTDTVKNYSGPSIPDSGYSLTLANGDVVTFSFAALVPEKAGQQTFFAYKITATKPSATVYNVTVTTDGNGSGYANPGSGVSGTEVTLTATPNDGYTFSHWEVISGGVTVTDNEFAIGNSDVEVKAFFEKIPEPIYNVTVTTDGNGSGYANPGSGVSGTEVTLTATPNEGYTFSHWEVISGDVTVTDNQLTIGNSDIEVKAIFEKIPDPVYNVTVTTDGNGSGYANPGSGVSGTEVTLTATPNDGYTFSHWEVISGGVTVTDNEFSIANSDVHVKAYFEKIPEPIYNVTVTTDGNGSGYANPGSGVSGTEVSLTATPNDGYTFSRWEVISGGVTISGGKLTIANSDVHVKAYFEKIPAATYTVTFNANGGSGTMAPQTFTEDVAQPLNRNDFTREGFTFSGWNTAPDGSGYSFADGATVTTTSNVVLYAQWKENPTVNPLLIVKQPTDQYVVEGQHAEFTVDATGDGVKYQWYINRNDGEGWKPLDGAIVSEYVTSVVDKDCDGYQYGCLVGDQYGNVLKSEVAVLHVSETPVLPETGDDSAPMLWLAMSMLSLIGIAALRRKSYN